MYKLAVKRDFIAQHFLFGGDWGPENQKHSHHYSLEIQLKGESLDNHGFLLDIVKVNEQLDELAARLRDRILNELPEFQGLNPSIENLAQIAYHSLYGAIRMAGIKSFKVRVWEDDLAWVSYQED